MSNGAATFTDYELAQALQQGVVTQARVTKFLRLCADPQRILDVLELMPADVGQAWHDAIQIQVNLDA